MHWSRRMVTRIVERTRWRRMDFRLHVWLFDQSVLGWMTIPLCEICNVYLDLGERWTAMWPANLNDWSGREYLEWNGTSERESSGCEVQRWATVLGVDTSMGNGVMIPGLLAFFLPSSLLFLQKSTDSFSSFFLTFFLPSLSLSLFEYSLSHIHRHTDTSTTSMDHHHNHHFKYFLFNN